MMRSVPGRVSSPAFIGRRAQLDALRAALAGLDADPRRVALVHGEAGIGKTRLLDELSRSLIDAPLSDRQTRVLRGTCLELGGGELPYAPIIDILDALARGADADDAKAAIRTLQDALGGAGPGDQVASGRGRTFVAIRDQLAAAAGDGDLVLAIDDVHWADRSTLELLSFVATRLGTSRILIVLAYRSDEIFRHHPLRQVIAELQRGGIAADIAIPPFGVRDLQDQLEAIVGGALSPGRLERIVALADGNPFHAEELAALDLDANELPSSLRDVLLARLERVDEATLGLLGRAAVIGRDVDEGLLSAVSDLPEAAQRAALREAIDHHVLEPVTGGRQYRFRHALLREAVLADLLLSERIALHRRVAEALVAQPELAAASPATAAAELAYHWTESGDTERAFPALLEAGERAQAAHAWIEASAAFERAATMARAGAGLLPAIDLAELQMRSAWLANYGGELTRGLALGQRAIEMDDGSDPLRTGDLLFWLSTLLSDGGEFDAATETTERAVKILEQAPSSLQRARAIGSLAGRRMTADRNREAIVLGVQAIALLRELDARPNLGISLSIHALACASLGRRDEARAAADESFEIFGELHDELAWEAGTIAANVPQALLIIGDFEPAISVVDEVMAQGRAIGAERGWTVWCESSAAHAAFFTGNWGMASERLERFRVDAEAGFPRLDVLLLDAGLALGRGDRQAIEESLRPSPEFGSHHWYAARFERIRALAALDDADPTAAVELIEPEVRKQTAFEETVGIAEVAGAAVRAYADLAERHRARRALADAEVATSRAGELAERVVAISAGTFMEGAMGMPWTQAIATAALAEAGRAAGSSDPAAWVAAAEAHAGLGTRPDVAYCRYREGEAWLGAGDRAAATVALERARVLAQEIGIVPLLGQIDALARRGRLSLNTAVAAPGLEAIGAPPDPWGLSVREREVLRLLSQGLTNQQIGDALFISNKTASVHVTHILDKMGVSSRTEAALLADRADLS
jgi:DNA-binding CsgD family transcriptional regulator/tetratricopeptide (TPR) repeat protein